MEIYSEDEPDKYVLALPKLMLVPLTVPTNASPLLVPVYILVATTTFPLLGSKMQTEAGVLSDVKAVSVPNEILVPLTVPTIAVA
tara:strand:+ start:397 stop:651 length:255 start_codon:yes stop_codon:yes gene_type:complete